MTRTCTTSRCAIPGPACALPTDAERTESTALSWSHVHSSLCGHIHPSATHVPLWRINGITAVIRVGLGSAIATRRADSVSGFSGNDASGEDARAFDGGNPGLHPAHHYR